MRTYACKIVSLMLLLALISCAAKQKNIYKSNESQEELRSIQSRVYDTTDRKRMLRTIIATLKDRGFVIVDADEALGTVSGTKREEYFLIMTVLVRPKGPHQMIVRSNAQYNENMHFKTIEDPEPYQQFYSALHRGLFLEASLNSSAVRPKSPEPPSGPGKIKSRPAKIEHKMSPVEPWTGVWSVKGYQISGKWVLKQAGTRVVSSACSDYRVEGEAVGNKLEGKLIIYSSHLYVLPVKLNLTSDGQQFSGTRRDFLGGTSIALNGQRVKIGTMDGDCSRENSTTQFNNEAGSVILGGFLEIILLLLSVMVK
jgi:hypothetical protein